MKTTKCTITFDLKYTDKYTDKYSLGKGYSAEFRRAFTDWLKSGKDHYFYLQSENDDKDTQPCNVKIKFEEQK